MSLCEYCGEKAAWLQSSHPACVERLNTIKQLVYDRTVAGSSYADLLAAIHDDLSFIDNKEVSQALSQVVNDAISNVSLQSPVSDDEFNRLFIIKGAFGHGRLQPATHS